MPEYSGALVVKSNADLAAEEDERRKAEESAQADLVVSGLASYIRKAWEVARDAKEPIKKEMLQAMRARAGEYSPAEMAALQKFGGSALYMMLTDEKCAAAEAWIEDFLFPPDERPWGTKPTPVPDVSPDMQQMLQMQLEAEVQADLEAGLYVSPEDLQVRALELVDELQKQLMKWAKDQDDKMETSLDDSLVEGGWYQALQDVIPDLVTHPAAFIKGPVVRREPTLGWGENPEGGGYKPIVEDTIVTKFERVSPHDIYPSPSSTDIDDGDLFEVQYLTAGDLYSMIGVDGYDEEAIRAVLSENRVGGGGGFSDWLWNTDNLERRALENKERERDDPRGKIVALQGWCSIPGRFLIEHGASADEVEDPEAEYAAEVWLIGNHVIRAELNGHPLGLKPYFKGHWRKVPGSFWGRGLPKILNGDQRACNAAARAMVNNMAIGSGPQVGVDTSALAEGEKVTQMFPWKIWQFNYGDRTSTIPPVTFFQPNIHTDKLLKVYEFFNKQAERKSVPDYAAGSEPNHTSGPLATASGFSMMLSNAAKGIKHVVRNIDTGIIEPSVKRMHTWLMLFKPGAGLKGDVKVVARGTSALVAREQQQVRKAEFLQLILRSPVAQQIMGPAKIAGALRSVSAGVGMEDAVPTEEEVTRSMMASMSPGQGQGQLPPGQEQPATLDAAGNPVAGQDVRTFDQAGVGA